MKLKTLFVGLVSGILLSACGGPLTEEDVNSTDELGSVQGAVCEGWDSGARRCSWKCTSSSLWRSVAVGTVGQNQCTSYATSQCGHSPNATCWSF